MAATSKSPSIQPGRQRGRIERGMDPLSTGDGTPARIGRNRGGTAQAFSGPDTPRGSVDLHATRSGRPLLWIFVTS
ncbi:MAG: hypothetical protein ABFC67_11610 [Mizugakiibacter sp.]|uniref:hypothetical protein n=1 Tax=Mizugakiibacter sp. TaxID=1972610 RepID=UPI0031C13C99|nr:hypothetical protein [Xanthomonadaceae bacterium]